MDASRFEAIVAAYGAEARRWPEAERAAAAAFATRPEAQAILGEARALDRQLDEARDDAPANLGLMRRVIQAAPKPGLGGLGWRPMAAMAACAVLGLALGVGGAQRAAQFAYAEAALSMAFAEGIGG